MINTGTVSVPCPRCGKNSSCTDTRRTKAGTRRRRQCYGCRHKFSTLEMAVPEDQLTGAVLAEGYLL